MTEYLVNFYIIRNVLNLSSTILGKFLPKELDKYFTEMFLRLNFYLWHHSTTPNRANISCSIFATKRLVWSRRLEEGCLHQAQQGCSNNKRKTPTGWGKQYTQMNNIWHKRIYFHKAAPGGEEIAIKDLSLHPKWRSKN